MYNAVKSLHNESKLLKTNSPRYGLVVAGTDSRKTIFRRPEFRAWLMQFKKLQGAINTVYIRYASPMVYDIGTKQDIL